eukprot:gene11520-11663_t
MPVIKAFANSIRCQQAAHPTQSSVGDDLQSEPSHGAAAECFVQLTRGKSSLVKNHLIAKPEKKVSISRPMMQLRSCSSFGGGAAQGKTAVQQVSLNVQSGTPCSSSETIKPGKAVTQQQQQLQSSSMAVARPSAARAEMAAAGEPAGQQQAMPQQTDARNPKSPKLVSSKSMKVLPTAAAAAPSNPIHPVAAAPLRSSGLALCCDKPLLQRQPAQFVTTRRLYDGKIAKVLQGHHATSGRPLALKIYSRSRLDTMERFQLAREVCLHMRSCHPHIASLYAAYKDSGHIYLLMELAPSGNLYQMLMSLQVPVGGTPRLPEQEAVVRVIGPLLSALSYLHEQGIIHRDIKLENVLLTSDGCIKLADFGLSIDTRHEVANTRLGTQGYFAPEVLVLPLKASPFEGKSPAEAAGRPCYDCKVDIWSAGVVCYEVLTGRAPFAAETVAKVVEAIQHRRLQYPGHLSSLATSFLSAALTRNPQQRPTARQLLQHPFIASHMANERT